MKPFYILSTGRCGTTFVSKMIRLNDQSIGEIHQLLDSKWMNVRANIALSSKGARNRYTASLSHKFDYVLPPSSTDPLRSVAYTFYLKDLLKKQQDLQDNTIIIHLVRDPRDFVSSFMNWKNRKFSGKIAHHLTPFWMPEPGVIKRWSMSKFEHFCWIWEKKNRLFYEEFAWFPGYYLFRMEDLRAGSEQLQILLSLVLGKDDVVTQLEDEDYNSTISKYFPYWNLWSPKQAGKLDTICSGMMQEFGYGGEMAWKKILGH